MSILASRCMPWTVIECSTLRGMASLRQPWSFLAIITSVGKHVQREYAWAACGETRVPAAGRRAAVVQRV